MPNEILNKYKDIANKIAKYYSYKNANLSFVKDSKGNAIYNFVLITLSNPKKESNPSNLSAAFLNTEKGILPVSFFMNKFYLFQASPEEIANYPENYVIYQDETFAYITEEMPEQVSEIARLFKIFVSFESIYLSEATHCKYEKISDYISRYDDLKEAIATSKEEKYIQYFKNECSQEKQIIVPLAKACSVLLGNLSYIYNQTTTPQGNFVVMRFSNNNDNTETGICLLISESNGKTIIKKATGRNSEGRFNTVDIPNKVSELLSLMQTKPKTSANKA